MTAKLNSRTWQRAKTEATNIRVRYHETEGVTWLIHRGWLAGFKAGREAERKARRTKVRR